LPQFPEIYADIARPDVVDVKALDAEGKPLPFDAAGCWHARCSTRRSPPWDPVHRSMTRKVKEQLRPELEAIQAEAKAILRK